MNYYKLLTQEMTSYNNTKWEVGVPIKISKEGNEMCSNSVLHCYNHPMLAVILNPIHAKIQNPRLFEISVDRIVNSDGLKFASKSQTLIQEIPLPEIFIEQRIEFGIRVAKLLCEDEKWNLWADKWLSGEDRSLESAKATAYAADAAAVDASAAAVYNYAYSYAVASAYAAHSAADAAIAYADAYAAYNYAYSYAAAYAANVAYDKDEFNRQMIDIIEKIVKVEV